jgi:segregation and condensation protein B
MSELALALEALLFVAAEPVPVATLVEVTLHPDEDVRAALDELSNCLEPTALRLQNHRDAWQLVTAPDLAPLVTTYLQGEAKTELSRAAFETLAMVAYRGPVSRADIDELRGVSSDTMIRNLLQRGLIIEQGRADTPGRPVLYGVSHRFLQHVGLTSLTDLPPLNEAVPE